MTISGIQGQQLEVTVVQCTRLKNMEFISRQDPYVYVEYGDAKYKTRTCTDGGKNPTFHDKFNFTLVEDRKEINVQVWNNNTFSVDDYICGGRVSLLNVLREGYDDSCWPLHCKNGRHAGEIRLIFRCPNLNKHPHNQATPAPSCPPPSAPPQPQSTPPVACAQPPPSAYPPVAFCPYHGPSSYPTVYHSPPVPMSFYAPAPYPPQPAVYHPPPFPPTAPPPATYPPAPYPGQCSGAYPPY